MFHSRQSQGKSAVAALTPQFRTMVVEDHSAFLNYVCSTLRNEANVEIVGEVQDGLAAVACAETLQPDLVILDIGLPGLNGLEVAKRILAFAPTAKIVFLTQESSRDIVHEALRLGACAYVTKTSAARELPLALHAVMQGNRFVSQGLDGDTPPNDLP